MPSGLLRSIWYILSKFSPLERRQIEQSEGLFLSNVFMSVCGIEKAAHLTLLPLPFFFGEFYKQNYFCKICYLSPYWEFAISPYFLWGFYQ